MAAQLFYPGRATDANGDPLSGATWSFYVSGTLTPQAVYADPTLTTSLGAVVTADSGGLFVPIYLDGDLLYRGILREADGSVVGTGPDPVLPMAVFESRNAAADLVGGLTAGTLVSLDEGGRSGIFKVVNGTAPADPLQGLYIQGAGKYLARQWDGINGRPEWFGAVANATNTVGSVTNTERTATTAALNAACTLLPAVVLSSGYYFTNAVVRASQNYFRLTGQGRGKTVISSNSAAAHILHVGGTRGSYYMERPYIEGISLLRTVAPTVPADTANDKTTAHGLHIAMTSNATVREVDTEANLVGTYWANALSPLWQDTFDLMTGNGARRYSWFIDGTMSDGIGSFPSLIVFRAFDIRQSNSSTSALSRGMFITGSFTDMQMDRVETAGCHNGLLISGAGGNAHFNSHWHDQYYLDGIRFNKTGGGSGENVTFIDCYAAPGVGATGQPFAINDAQNVQIIAAQVTSYPGGGDGKIGVRFSGCVECTFQGSVINHSTGVYLLNCFGCTVDAKVSKTAGGAGTDCVKVESGYGNRVIVANIGVSGSVGYTTGVALTTSPGNMVDVTGIQDSQVTNRVMLGGTPFTGAGNASGQNFVIRPGATFATAST